MRALYIAGANKLIAIAESEKAIMDFNQLKEISK
jgi:hypothetical protein